MDERLLRDKGGRITVFLIVALALILAIVGMIILIGIISGNLNSALDKSVSIGQVNLQTINNETFGQFNQMIVNNADFWGLASIMATILALFIASYILRNRSPAFMLSVDIFLIIGAFVFSLYLRGVYSDVSIALTNAGQTFITDNLHGTNFFILNLPIFVAVIGVVMMILFYSTIPPKVDELNIGPNIVTG